MKLTQVSAVQDNTSLHSTTFTVANNNVAFKVLSTSLYSDKPKAILRELVSNALDANKEAGNGDVPVDITLPSMLDEYLIIADKGNGMSEEFLTERYTVLFDSTKRDTNDAIGGFGIGRLSAFSLVDSYTIETIHKQTKITAYAYIDNHVPNVTIVGKEHSDAPSGTTVKIPFPNVERSKLESLCKELFSYWEVVPRVDGVDIPASNKMLHTNDDDLEYYISRETAYGYMHSDLSLLPLVFPKVLVGGIPYEVPRAMYDVNARVTAHADKLVKELYAVRTLLSTDNYERNVFLLNAPIGELELSPSREKVETNEATALYLLKKFHEIGATLKDSMRDQILAATADMDDVGHTYMNGSYEEIKQCVETFKEDHKAILKFAGDQSSSYSSKVNNNDQAAADKVILGKESAALVAEIQEYSLNRYLNLYDCIFSKHSSTYIHTSNNYSRYYPDSKKNKWSTKSTISGFLDGIYDNKIALIDSTDPIGSKVIREMRILVNKLEDDDIEGIFQHNNANPAELKEFFVDYLGFEIVDLDLEDAMTYIRANRKKVSAANVNRTLDKPFSQGYSINDFYTNVEADPDYKHIVIHVPRGMTNRATNLNNFANRIKAFTSKFYGVTTHVTDVTEPSNKRFIKFVEENENVKLVDLIKARSWPTNMEFSGYCDSILDFIVGNDAKTFKLIHFNLSLIQKWDTSYTYPQTFSLPMRKLYRRLFTANQIRVIAKYTRGFAHYLNYLKKSDLASNYKGFSYTSHLNDAIQLYSKSSYINEKALFGSIYAERKAIYIQLKQEKDKKNDTSSSNP